MKKTVILFCLITSLFSIERDITSLMDNLNSETDVESLLNSLDEKKDVDEAKRKLTESIKDKDYKFYSKKLTLKESILNTIKNSNNIKASVEEVIQLENQFYIAKGKFFPTVAVSAGQAFVDSDEDGEKTNNTETTYKLTIDQNIYAGGSTLSGYRESQSKYLAKVNKHKGLVEKEVNKAIVAYLNVVFDRETLEATKENMEKLNEILSLVEIKFDAGAVTAGDLNAIKAGVANARVAFVSAESKYQESLDYYEYAVERLQQNQMPYENNISTVIEGLDVVLDKAYSQNALYLAELYNLKTKEYALENAYAKRYPSFDFKLTYTDLDTQGDTPSVSKETNALFKLSYDLYDGGKREYEVVVAKSSIAEIQYTLAENRKKLKWDVSKLYKSIQSLRSSILSSEIELIANVKVVSSYWDEFKLGSKDLQKLLTAQRQLNTSRTDLIKYRKAVIVDYFSLLEKTGELLDYFDIPFYSKLGTVK